LVTFSATTSNPQVERDVAHVAFGQSSFMSEKIRIPCARVLFLQELDGLQQAPVIS